MLRHHGSWLLPAMSPTVIGGYSHALNVTFAGEWHVNSHYALHIETLVIIMFVSTTTPACHDHHWLQITIPKVSRCWLITLTSRGMATEYYLRRWCDNRRHTPITRQVFAIVAIVTTAVKTSVHQAALSHYIARAISHCRLILRHGYHVEFGCRCLRKSENIAGGLWPWKGIVIAKYSMRPWRYIATRDGALLAASATPLTRAVNTSPYTARRCWRVVLPL